MADENILAKINIIPGSVEEAPVVFADGVTAISFGANVCKIDFHQVTQSDNSKKSETRKVIMRAVIPLPALVELCNNILKNISANEAQLRDNIHQQTDQMFASLPGIEAQTREANEK